MSISIFGPKKPETILLKWLQALSKFELSMQQKNSDTVIFLYIPAFSTSR
jgi:hypothetical protein